MSHLTVKQEPWEDTSLNISQRLLPNDHILTGAIFEKCMSTEPFIDQHPYMRKVALTLSTGASLTAGAFFFPVSLELPIGPLFSICNLVSYLKLDIWAIRGAVNDVLGAKSAHEIELMNRSSKGKFYSSLVLISSLAIATLFQIPPALPAFTYDGSLGMPSFVILIAGGIFVPTRSMQLSIHRIFQTRNCCLTQIAKKMETLRQQTLALVDQHQEVFRKMGYEKQLEHVQKLNQLTNDPQKDAINFVTQVLSPTLDSVEPPKSCLAKYIPKLPGAWIAGSLWTGVSYYTYEKTKRNLIDDDYVAGSLAGATVLLGVYFSSLSIINTTEKIMNFAYKSLTCQKQKNLAEQLRSKLFLSLHLLGFIVDLGALGSTHVIWGDFFKDQLEERIYFETTVGLANFLFLTSATIDMIGEVVEEVIHKWGDQEEREIIELKRKLTHLQNLFSSSSLLDFGLFINKMSPEHKMNLLKKVDLSIEQLDQLISNQKETYEVV